MVRSCSGSSIKEKDGNFDSLQPYDLPDAPIVKQPTNEDPTLAEATLAALEVLNQDEDGFFVMIEQGDIDWSNTLLISTSDHSNSYLRRIATLGAGDLPAQNGNQYDAREVTYGSGGHTNELTRLCAKGAGVNAFRRYENQWYRGTGIIDNTHIYHAMRDAAGISVAPRLKLAKSRPR